MLVLIATRIGSAGVSDRYGFMDFLVGEFVGITPPAPAARSDVDRIGAVFHGRLYHFQVSCGR